MEDAAFRDYAHHRQPRAVPMTDARRDAAEKGKRYAMADEGVKPDFDIFDTSPEASAFWDAVDAEARRVARLVLALEDEEVE